MSLIWAIATLILCSAIFEPLRNASHKLGEGVGGVGGVGGLTNLRDPNSCTSAAGKVGAYCFQEGVLLGLTPFACIFLAFWVLPFCVIACLTKNRYQSGHRQPLTELTEREATKTGDGKKVFSFMWGGLSILWFCVPMIQYALDDFFQKDAYHAILAIAIAAAFPLSWHLALVAIPVPQFMAEMLGMSGKELLSYHKMGGAAVGCWAALHAGGELVYLTQKGSRLNIMVNGENLIYVLGVTAAALVAVHVAISQVRHKLPKFKQLHGVLAAVLLLVAAAHWWPFTFLLIPAAGVQATSLALNRLEQPMPIEEQQPPSVANAHTGKVLAGATLSATCAMCLVWQLRQIYMMSIGAGLLLPFVFPPVALLVGFGVSFAVANVMLKFLPQGGC